MYLNIDDVPYPRINSRDRNMVVGPFRDSIEIPAVVLGAEIQYMARRIATVHLDENWRDIAGAHQIHAQNLETMVCRSA